MIILDTDHLNILQIGKGASYDTLAVYIDVFTDHHFATTVGQVRVSIPSSLWN